MKVMRNSQHTRASICTYTGVEFFPLAPRSEDIYIEDIAHALACVTRYNGHSIAPYSIAQHSVLVSRHAEKICHDFEQRRRPAAGEPPIIERTSPAEAAKWGLLHDAAEAYISDICAPIKPFMQGYKEIELQLEREIARRFYLPWPMPAVVGYSDKAVFRSELESGIMKKVDWWHLHEEHPSAGLVIVPFKWDAAKDHFVNRFIQLFGEEFYYAHRRP